MTSVTLSPKFQIVIPRDIRRALSLVPGQCLEARLQGDRIELVPIQPMAAMRGLFRGIDTRVPDDEIEPPTRPLP
jgi:AbrB family looped-hinge helix DNA binding protein